MSAAPSTQVHELHEYDLIDPRTTGGRMRAYCPIHGSDRKRSLSIALEGDAAGWGYCHACEAKVRVIELMPTAVSQRRQAPTPAAVIGYPALMPDGQLAGVHMRKPTRNAQGEPDKSMWWEQHAGRKVADMPLYPLLDLLEAKAAAEQAGRRLTVLLCEGERKVDVANAALRRAGKEWMLAVGTMTGAGVTPCDESLRPLLGCEVWLWPDNDEKGQTHMERIAMRLVALGGSTPTWVEWKEAPPKGDVADYFAAGGTVDGLAALISVAPAPHPPATSAGTLTVRRWPNPLDERAYHGVLGKIAREMEPYIEADSAALLINLLTAAGVAMGRSAHMRVGAKRHYACAYVVNVGATGDNKGDGWWPIDTLLEQVTANGEADGLPLRPQTWGGMSTGEGLLWQVRDERRELRQGRKGEPAEEVLADAGVQDKRLLAYEPEFARVLAVMYREGNTLSMILRDLYDGASTARSSPKANPIIATGAHFGMIGQITPEELGRKLHEVELFNGFANRFLWVLTRRQHSRPNPPPYTAEAAAKHATEWSQAIARARAVGEVTRDATAAQVWEQLYEALRTGERDGKPARSGMALDVCARAHVYVLRNSLIFAALDGSTVVTPAHQEAALAIWDYAEACAMYLFGHVSGDPIAEVIADALTARGPLTRTQISRLFNRHVESGAIQTALDTLAASGRARMWKEQTSGGPRELWGAS